MPKSSFIELSLQTPLTQRFFIVFILLTIFSSEVISQVEKDSLCKDLPLHSRYYQSGIGPTIGYRGINNHLPELGITFAGVGHGVVGFEFSYLSNLKKGEEHLSGFSAGYYTGFAFFETGILTTVYTNFQKSRLYIKPYLGAGIGGFSTVSYGYNFSIGKNIFKEQISTHELRLIVRLPFRVIN